MKPFSNLNPSEEYQLTDKLSDETTQRLLSIHDLIEDLSTVVDNIKDVIASCLPPSTLLDDDLAELALCEEHPGMLKRVTGYLENTRDRTNQGCAQAVDILNTAVQTLNTIIELKGS